MAIVLRSSSFVAALGLAMLCTGCVIAPNTDTSSTRAAEVAKMSDQAVATCGAGQVKEVNAKSFSCR